MKSSLLAPIVMSTSFPKLSATALGNIGSKKLCKIEPFPLAQLCQKMLTYPHVSGMKDSEKCYFEAWAQPEGNNFNHCIALVNEKSNNYLNSFAYRCIDNACSSWKNDFRNQANSTTAELAQVCYEDVGCEIDNKPYNFITWMGNSSYFTGCINDSLVAADNCETELHDNCKPGDSRYLASPSSEECSKTLMNCSTNLKSILNGSCKGLDEDPNSEAIPASQTFSNHSKEKIAGLVALVVLCAMAAKKKLSNSVPSGFHSLQPIDIEMTQAVNPSPVQDMRLAS